MSNPKHGGLWETVKTVVYAVLIALGIRTFAYEPFNIPSGSMIPTLLIGDYLFVSKFSYGYSRYSFPFSPPLFEGRILQQDVDRGDVAVFKLPRDGSTDYIKRIVGLPGDRIQMKKGILYINDQPVERKRIEDFEPGVRGSGGPPVAQYFAMGDIRSNSHDSRAAGGVGFIPAESLIGRAEFLFFSVNGQARIWEVWNWPRAIRYDRLLTAIH